MKLYIYDTEGYEEEPEQFASATGWPVQILGRKWSKGHKLEHSTPESLLKAIETAEADADSILLVDSATSVADQKRDAYALKHGKSAREIPYAIVDAAMKPVVNALKQAECHWILTMMERDDKLGSQTVGKKGKASKNLEYVARIKIHCEQQKPPLNTKVTIRDQRSLKDTEPAVFVDPTVDDLSFLVEPYTRGGPRVLKAHTFGRDAGGKTGTAMRLAMALARKLGRPEGGDQRGQ
jgi:tetrahydromethanopterin S-methyltransferase subunit H